VIVMFSKVISTTELVNIKPFVLCEICTNTYLTQIKILNPQGILIIIQSIYLLLQKREWGSEVLSNIREATPTNRCQFGTETHSTDSRVKSQFWQETELLELHIYHLHLLITSVWELKQKESGMVMHTWNSRTQETEAGGSWDSG
jgi:hypothetical protein